MRAGRVAAAGVLLLTIVGGGSAHADVGSPPPALTVAAGHPVTRSYPPILGTGGAVIDTASGTTTGPTPAACIAAVYCDVIPLTVNRPPGRAGDLVLTIDMAWKTTPINLQVTGTNSDVMELQVWAVSPGRAPTLAARSAHPFEPASVTILGPSSEHYDVVVENGLGVNQGFQLAVSLVSTTGYTPPATPVETPSSTAAPSPTAGPGAVPTTPIGATATTTTVGAVPAPPPETPPTLPPDLGVIGSPLLAAAPPLAPARSPSAIAVLVWLLALPILIVAAAAVTVTRRGRGAPRDPRPRRRGE
jgi:hypothetical protein